MRGLRVNQAYCFAYRNVDPSLRTTGILRRAQVTLRLNRLTRLGPARKALSDGPVEASPQVSRRFLLDEGGAL